LLEALVVNVTAKISYNPAPSQAAVNGVQARFTASSTEVIERLPVPKALHEWPTSTG
jgi:hypothetical protein